MLQIVVMTPDDLDLDIPELQLVIQLAPPTRMLQFSQVSSCHMMLCRSTEEVAAVKTLFRKWKREKKQMKMA
jgi:hypothetical protein